MDGNFTFDRLLWSITFLINTALVVLLVYRKNHRVFPFFFIYALLNLLQGVVLFESYRIWGFRSAVSMRVAWSAQGLVTFTRAVAVSEICHRVLAKFRGIWGLAWRLLFAAGAFISFYAWGVSRGSWPFAILNLDRGLELAMTTVIVLLFAFARYYEVGVEPAVQTVAIGFFLYSCLHVLNDTILEAGSHRYATLWNLLGTLSFLASMLLWSCAFRRTQPATTFETELMPEDLYRTLAPEIDARLRELNEQLRHFWHAKGKRT
jgi:hypothetical protein